MAKTRLRQESALGTVAFAHERAEIRFADGRQDRVPLERIGEFISDSQNPGPALVAVGVAPPLSQHAAILRHNLDSLLTECAGYLNVALNEGLRRRLNGGGA